LPVFNNKESGVPEIWPEKAEFMSRISKFPVLSNLRFYRRWFCATLFLLLLSFLTMSWSSAWQPSPHSKLLITEFYYNPPGLDEEREWVEIANMSDQSLQLSGYGLGDEEQIGQGEGMLRFPEGSEIGAGEGIVIAQTAVGFRALFGVNPDFEIRDTDETIPDMLVDTQWASGQFVLANDGDEIILVDDQNNFLDALNYGDRLTFFTPNIPGVVSGQSIERSPAFCDTDSAADWRPQTIPTPGQFIMSGKCAPATDQNDEFQYRPIGEIQGTGEVSPYLNQVVTFRGLVTGTLEDQNTAGVTYYTIFVQDIPGFEDGDPDTSDAIAVFLGRQQPRYQIGDQVEITGQVTEYFGLTEIDDTGIFITSESSGNSLPEAVAIEIPQDAVHAEVYLESLEGMLVNATGSLPVLGPTHEGCGFAVGSTPDAIRPLRHSGHENYPPPILVLNQSDVDCSALPPLKSGDLVAGILGPLTYHFEQYKVVQQESESLRVEHAGMVPLTKAPGASESLIRIATMNLDNFLVPSADDGSSPSEGMPPEDSEIKRSKLAFTISQTLRCPEIIGVQEVENETLLLQLANSTAESCRFSYQVTHRESADGRGIDVALLTDPRRVTIDGVALRQTCWPIATGVQDGSVQCPPGEEPLFSRPPLEVALEIDGEPMTIFVNHFKSKRGGELETAARRLAQARHVHDLVMNHLTDDPQDGIIVLGDFNDYNQSPVWLQLQAEGVLYDAMQRTPPEERYSYIFDGVAQLVDGILVSPALIHRIKEVVIPHINADYPVSYAFDGSSMALPYHASDHDPVLLSLGIHSQDDIREKQREPSREPEPAATMLPTEQPFVAAVTLPPTRPVEQIIQASETGSRDSFFIITGLVMLLLATAVLWLAQRLNR
jgi:predicted extracellular nuclease